MAIPLREFSHIYKFIDSLIDKLSSQRIIHRVSGKEINGKCSVLLENKQENVDFILKYTAFFLLNTQWC